MKNIYLFISTLCCVISFGQQRKPLADKIAALHAEYQFEELSLFTIAPKIKGQYKDALSDYTLLKLDQQAVNAMIQNRPEAFSMRLPYKGAFITIELYRLAAAPPALHVVSQQGGNFAYNPGVYYHGILQGDTTSMAALSFYSGQCSGVISSLTLGDINLGRINRPGNQLDYILYSMNDALFDHSLQCHTPELPSNAEPVPVHFGAKNANDVQKCVKLYYELSYDLYQAHGEDMQAAVDWITAMHNILLAVYENDGIEGLLLNEIFVWDTPDPYSQVLGPVESQFASYRASFNGDAAILLKDPGGNGFAAGVGELCQETNESGPFCTMQYQMTFEDFPVWSSNIMLLSHETGHVLGSPHTHKCVWNGNNTQIDDCGNVNPVFGVAEGAACFDPDAPILLDVGQGTIMSYCAGSLAAGFGPQPTARIMDHIASTSCISTTCGISCTPTLAGLTVSQITDNSALITIEDTDPDASQWVLNFFGSNENIIITENPFLLENLSPNTLVQIYVRQVCDAPLTADFMKSIYFETVAAPVLVCGTTIYEYGSQDIEANYPFTQTIYPETANQVISIHFNYIETDLNTVYLYDDINANGFPAVTYYGSLQDIPDFTATNASGAVTIGYSTSGDVIETGFEAQINCISTLGVGEVMENNAISVYPNPVESVIYVELASGITHVSITDLLGRSILEKDFKSSKAGLDLGSLSSGTYLLSVNDANGSMSQHKILKK